MFLQNEMFSGFRFMMKTVCHAVLLALAADILKTQFLVTYLFAVSIFYYFEV